MKQVYQRVKHASTYQGDCLTACVASILELPISKVPMFSSPNWRDALNKFLENFALYSLCLPFQLYHGVVKGYYIATVYIQKLKLLHAVVGFNGTLCFDPSGLNFNYEYVPISVEVFSKLYH